MLIGARQAFATSLLPYDAEVEYIESTGTQWIDTGIVPTNSHGFSISCALNGVSVTSYNSRAIGVHQGTVRWLFSLQILGDNNNTFFGWNNAISNLGGYSNLQIVEASLNFLNNRKAILGGSVKASDLGNLGTISRPAYLFANNRDASGEMFLGRIYSCKISNGGVLVRDFIPVRVGAVGYMYDKVSGRLFGNQGTGSFVVGPDVVEVEYLESTGTQWIDTGIYLTNNHSVEIDFQLTTISQSRTGLFGGYSTSRYGGLVSPSNSKIEFGYGSSNVYYQVDCDTTRHLVKQNKNLLYIDGTLANTFPVATFTSNYSAPLGNFQFTNYNPALARYYSSKWYDGDILIRDFVPVRVGTEGAMMDVLTRRIYRNAGSGAFTYGDDLEYPIPAA